MLIPLSSECFCTIFIKQPVSHTLHILPLFHVETSLLSFSSIQCASPSISASLVVESVVFDWRVEVAIIRVARFVVRVDRMRGDRSL